MRRKEWGYGFFSGGDPRRFSPDEDSCTAEEIDSHKAACERWDAGDTTAIPGSCIHGPGYIITLSGFGLGSYWYEEDDGPWHPRALRYPPPRRTPRRIKKRANCAGWALTDYGWEHESAVACTPPLEIC
jgi:hypothetical protein